MRNFIHVSDDAGHRDHGALHPPQALDFQPVGSGAATSVFSNQFFNQFAQSPVHAPVNVSLLTQSGMSLAGASKQRHARGEQPSPVRQLPDASALHVANQSSDNRGNPLELDSRGTGSGSKPSPTKAESASKLGRRQSGEQKAGEVPLLQYSGQQNAAMDAPDGSGLARLQPSRASAGASSRDLGSQSARPGGALPEPPSSS